MLFLIYCAVCKFLYIRLRSVGYDRKCLTLEPCSSLSSFDRHDVAVDNDGRRLQDIHHDELAVRVDTCHRGLPDNCSRHRLRHRTRRFRRRLGHRSDGLQTRTMISSIALHLISWANFARVKYGSLIPLDASFVVPRV